jgi:hypothetical protein
MVGTGRFELPQGVTCVTRPSHAFYLCACATLRRDSLGVLAVGQQGITAKHTFAK